MFFDIQQWEQYLINNEFGFGVGGRFHGNLMTMLQGIPSLWLVHDSRTSELTEVLKLPRLKMEELENIKSVQELKGYCVYNGEFYKNRCNLNRDYNQFLRVNGLERRFPM